jgi:hypothetical protein
LRGDEPSAGKSQQNEPEAEDEDVEREVIDLATSEDDDVEPDDDVAEA